MFPKEQKNVSPTMQSGNLAVVVQNPIDDGVILQSVLRIDRRTQTLRQAHLLGGPKDEIA